MSTSETIPTIEPAAPEPRRGTLTILLGTIIRPRSTFAYLRDQRGWAWLLPLALALALTLVARVIAVPIERAQAEAAMQQLQEQLGDLPASGDGPGGNVIIRRGPGALFGGGPAGSASSNDWLFSYGLPLGSLLLDWVLRGALLLGLASLLGGRPSLGAMFVLSSFSLLPTIARLIVTIAVMLTAHQIPVSGMSGLGGDAAPEMVTVDGGEGGDFTFSAGAQVAIGPGGAERGSGPSFVDLFSQNLLGSLDVYTLWTLGLLVIGVAVMARLGWLRAALSTGLYWAASLALATLPVLVMPLLMPLLSGGSMFVP